MLENADTEESKIIFVLKSCEPEVLWGFRPIIVYSEACYDIV